MKITLSYNSMIMTNFKLKSVIGKKIEIKNVSYMDMLISDWL